jgi:MFS family permease
VLVARIGERQAMIYSAAFSAVGIATSVLIPNLLFLGIGVLLVGLGHSVFGLARQVYIAQHIPYSHRARALSIIGGTFRVGAFLGPFLSALVISLFGIPAVFLFSMLLWLLAATVVLFTKEVPEKLNASSMRRTFQIAKRERGQLLGVGIVAMIVVVLRTTRTIGLPLLAIALGIPPETAALYIGIGGAIELSLFYISGQVMDRFGRRWAAFPTLIGMSVGNLLFFTVNGSSMFLVVTVILAFANAFSSGLVLVLGADAAPEDARSEFLASFRLLIDTGAALTSPVMSLMILILGSLAPTMAIFSGIGIVGFVLARKFLPKPKKFLASS